MLDHRARDERSDRLARVQELIHQRLSNGDGDAVGEFVQSFYANVADEDILAQTAESLFGAALALWKFAARRPPNLPRLRAYNPQIEEHGWQSPHTIVEIVNDDMPFLVDSVTGYLNRHGYNVRLVIHPVIDVARDGDGRRVDGAPEGGVRESLMHIQIDEQADGSVHSGIVNDLMAVLSDVRSAVEDWPAMLTRLDEAVGELERPGLPLDAGEVDEARDFLAWMRDDQFTFLGCRDYSYEPGAVDGRTQVVSASGLGILRDEHRHVLTPPGMPSDADVAPIVQQFIARPELLLITKTSVRGTVHRPVHMDYIGVKRYDDDGQVIGERRFVGLFTASAYNSLPRDIPVLRRKAARTLEMIGVAPESHDGKALSHIVETYPRDELWQIE
jgi:glutamate dehydrogenase